jgi:hypothetical protein
VGGCEGKGEGRRGKEEEGGKGDTSALFIFRGLAS